MDTGLVVTAEGIEAYRRELLRRERSRGTVEQYVRAVEQLAVFLQERPAHAELLQGWKGTLLERCSIATVNAMIAAVNGFFDFCGMPELKLKSLRCQRQFFRETELTEEDYRALLHRAESCGEAQTALLLKTMACTGVRVSELKVLTVESAKRGMAVIQLKGKVRQIPLGRELCRELISFTRQEKITSGAIFRSRRGRPLDRRRVWERLKALCAGTTVDPQKVHPHALRHLFARMFYKLTGDVVKLSDLLGHSSINTTRIYTATSPEEHRQMLDHLAAVIHAKKPPRRGGLIQIGQNQYFVRLHNARGQSNRF